jgi:deazaflavin-dependent oxidoreductase (nitroreductase family)
MDYFVFGLLLAAAGVVALVLLVLVYRVLKAAHTRPHGGAGHSHGAEGHPVRPADRMVLRLVTKSLVTSLRLGIQFGPMMMLTLPGRKSGIPRTNPVDLWVGDGRRFLVATHTENAAWVHNLRAAGEGVLWLGRKRWAFTAVELSLDEAAQVIKNVLGPRMQRPIAGFVLRQTVGVPPNSTSEECLAAARVHPVFEVELTRIPRRRPVAQTRSTEPNPGRNRNHITPVEETK